MPADRGSTHPDDRHRSEREDGRRKRSRSRDHRNRDQERRASPRRRESERDRRRREPSWSPRAERESSGTPRGTPGSGSARRSSKRERVPSPDIRADCRALCALGGLDGDEAQHPAAIAALLGRLSAAGQGHFSEEPLSIIAAWDADDEALRALAVAGGIAPPRLPGAAERLPFEGEQWRARIPEEELICEPDVAPDAIPLEAGASQPATADPRRAFLEEYALLASWVQKQAVPAFAHPASDSPPSPPSWAASQQARRRGRRRGRGRGRGRTAGNRGRGPGRPRRSAPRGRLRLCGRCGAGGRGLDSH